MIESRKENKELKELLATSEKQTIGKIKEFAKKEADKIYELKRFAMPEPSKESKMFMTGLNE